MKPDTHRGEGAVKRYDSMGFVAELGLYVRWADYDDLATQLRELRAMVERYASECGECGGTGVSVSYRHDISGGQRITADCLDCADIRAALVATDSGRGG